MNCVRCNSKLTTYKCIKCKLRYCEFHLKLADHNCINFMNSKSNKAIEFLLDRYDDMHEVILQRLPKRPIINELQHRIELLELLVLGCEFIDNNTKKLLLRH